MAGKSKYKAVRTAVDGLIFDSKHEAECYMQFRALERSGAIVKLERQVPFLIHAGTPDPEPYPYAIASGAVGTMPAFVSDTVTMTLSPKRKPICKYIADFVYEERQRDGSWRDAKGMKTPVYKLKKKFVEAEYGITIVEL